MNKTINISSLESIATKAMGCSDCFEQHAVKHAYIEKAQPRFVGKDYWNSKSRVAFVMLNPGAGSACERDQNWNLTLQGFMAGAIDLHEVFDCQKRHMPHWGRGKLVRFIQAHGLDLEEIAIVNIAWCSTLGNQYPKAMLSHCFEKHTLAWIKELDPNKVILSGTNTHGFSDVIQRSIPKVEIYPGYHYAHRPNTAARANERVADIRSQLKIST
ncbi:hypothetical protein N9193_04410 [Pseudomonadales bacterium]|nr:hypothetical protein [Pseudomonadales bacterium]